MHHKLILSNIRRLLNIICRCMEILVYFLYCVPEKWHVFSPPVWVQLYSKFWLLALFCVSLKRLDRGLFKPHRIIFMMYIIMSEIFIKIDSLKHFSWNFKTNLAYEPTKNPRYNIHSSRQTPYANFCKLMPTIHISMANTLRCEHYQCFYIQNMQKKVILKCTNHGDMYGEL